MSNTAFAMERPATKQEGVNEENSEVKFAITFEPREIRERLNAIALIIRKIARSGKAQSLDGFSAVWALMTPDAARKLMPFNDGNRDIHQSAVGRHSSAMEKEQWEYCGDTIVFDSNGHLRNGQHRLMAVINSGKSIPVLIVVGVHPDSFANMDISSMRTLADAVKIAKLDGRKGELSAQSIAATAKEYHRIRVVKNKQGGSVLSHHEGLGLVESIPEIRQAVRFLASLKLPKRNIIPPGVAGGVLACLYELKCDELAEGFMERILTGDGIQKGSQESKLRSKLLNIAFKSNKKLTSVYARLLTIKAWNNLRSNKNPKNLVMPKDAIEPK